MYLLVTIVACLVSTGYGYDYGSSPRYHSYVPQRIFHDDTLYNPCDASSGVFFHPHRSDPNKYYQCDESNSAFLRSCGKLVWDDLSKTCNRPTAVMSGSSTWLPTFPTTTTTAPVITFWPTFITFLPTVTTSNTTTMNTTTTTPSTIIPQTSTSSTTETKPTGAGSTFISICETKKPCGEHGECIESSADVPEESRRYACICDENWFGRVCDQRIDDLVGSGKKAVRLAGLTTKTACPLPTSNQEHAQKSSIELHDNVRPISKPLDPEEFNRKFA